MHESGAIEPQRAGRNRVMYSIAAIAAACSEQQLATWNLLQRFRIWPTIDIQPGPAINRRAGRGLHPK
jgi:hypothetical protein